MFTIKLQAKRWACCTTKRWGLLHELVTKRM